MSLGNSIFMALAQNSFSENPTFLNLLLLLEILRIFNFRFLAKSLLFSVPEPVAIISVEKCRCVWTWNALCWRGRIAWRRSTSTRLSHGFSPPSITATCTSGTTPRKRSSRPWRLGNSNLSNKSNFLIPKLFYRPALDLLSFRYNLERHILYS